MNELLGITKALSDKTRVRALMSVKDGELCLCQIIQLLGLSPSTVSKHMNVLQRVQLVERRKEGRWHFYRLAAEEGSPAAKRALNWIVAELRSEPTIVADAKKIREVRKKNLDELSACYRT